MHDISASIRDRIYARSREKGEDFQLLALRYAYERFLFRLSVSEHRDSCILKGASLIGLWMSDPYRSTRDLDLLAFGPSDASSVKRLIASICSIQCPEDGLSFDLDGIRVEAIRETADYGGQRAKVNAVLARAIIHLQIDIGFGDAVMPVDEEYPLILQGLPAPRLRAYPREYVVAEKFAAMLSLGRGNSRMKDFHDLWALSMNFPFELPSLSSAVGNSFGRRGLLLGADAPEALRPAFYEDGMLQERWTAYRKKSSSLVPPPAAFSAIGSALGAFLSPLRQAIMMNDVPGKTWPPGGPWR
jgi:predicted nucleotidyltransferase component of viral defense system